MSATYAEKRTAIKRAIEVMKTWHERVPASYGGKIPESVKALEEVFADYKQQKLPWGECRETLGYDGRCAACGWNANTRSYEPVAKRELST